MDYYIKYLKYKSKYLSLKKDNENIIEYDVHPLAYLKKYNFSQYGGELPKIYETDIPTRLETFFKNKDSKIGIIYAPTGYGKTVAGCRTIAKVINEKRAAGDETITGKILMPFRASVKAMWTRLNYLDSAEPFSYGFAMKGDKQNDRGDAVVETIGFWLAKNKDNKKEQIIMLDEVHDITWQTDLTLNLLLWKISEGAPIKLLLSSATLNIDEIKAKYSIEPEIFSIEDDLSNHDIIYNQIKFNPLRGTQIKDETFDWIKITILKVYPETTGHILVLLPGKKEIYKIIDSLDGFVSTILKDALIMPLHSELSKDKIEMAINPNDKRKIILATNMVENAITIDNLSATIDSCIRKELYKDFNEIQELKSVIASKASIKQTYGRSGRQGVKGKAYIALSKDNFDNDAITPKFSLNEIERTPIFKQLLELLKNNLPFEKILKSVSKVKMSNNIKYLLEKKVIQAIIIEEKITGYELTNKGKIVSLLNLKLNNAIFIADCIESTETKSPNYYFYVLLIAAWLEEETSIFKDTKNKRNQSTLLKDDTFKTFLNVYNEYQKKEHVDKSTWCDDFGINISTIKSILELFTIISEILYTSSNKIKSRYQQSDTNDEFIKTQLTNQLIKSFEYFKLRGGGILYENMKEEPYRISSDIMISMTPPEYILGLTFYKTDDIYIKNFVIRVRDEDDDKLDGIKETRRIEEEAKREEEERIKADATRIKAEADRIKAEEVMQAKSLDERLLDLAERRRRLLAAKEAKKAAKNK